jgi:hypothetical protein
MTPEEAEVRSEWQETVQQLALRVGALCCAALVVRLPSGDEAIGTAFHVGEGVYLTARRVGVANAPHGYLAVEQHVAGGPFYHEDERIDVAAFVAGGIDPNTPSMALGFHYDDWITDRDWLLTTGTVFGYPPVPTAAGAVQLAATVEVNGVVDTYRDRYVRFVVSAGSAGGRSIILAVSCWEW